MIILCPYICVMATNNEQDGMRMIFKTKTTTTTTLQTSTKTLRCHGKDIVDID